VCAACLAHVRRAPSEPPPAALDAWAAAFAYEGVIREVVARAKYRNTRASIPWLAAAAVAATREAGLTAEVVTWAPTTPSRRRARGFDPAEILARAIARRLSLPTARLLVRRPGPPQTGRPRAERRVGPQMVARAPAPSRVLLVDDVATTGATLDAAALALRDAGALSVVAVTVARTPSPGCDHDRSAHRNGEREGFPILGEAP
jgi:predicted amidophosphoribosyltransferase